MHIVCPNCTTSFAINPAALGETGRTVRCSRCKLTWLARPDEALETVAAAAASPSAGRDVAAEWDAMGQDEQTPMVESPSVAPDWPAQAAQHEAGAGEDGDNSKQCSHEMILAATEAVPIDSSRSGRRPHRLFRAMTELCA